MADTKKIEDFAKKCYDEKDFVHGWPHIEAVKKKAFKLAKNYNTDREALEIAILLHDCDYSAPELHTENSAEKAGNFLKTINYPKFKIEKVKQIILAHTTHIRESQGDTKLIEGKILYDADKMEIMTPKGLLRFVKQWYNLPLSEIIKKIKKSCLRIHVLYLEESKNMIKEDYEVMKKFVENIEKEIGKSK